MQVNQFILSFITIVWGSIFFKTVGITCVTDVTKILELSFSVVIGCPREAATMLAQYSRLFIPLPNKKRKYHIRGRKSSHSLTGARSEWHENQFRLLNCELVASWQESSSGVHGFEALRQTDCHEYAYSRIPGERSPLVEISQKWSYKRGIFGEGGCQLRSNVDALTTCICLQVYQHTKSLNVAAA